MGNVFDEVTGMINSLIDAGVYKNPEYAVDLSTLKDDCAIIESIMEKGESNWHSVDEDAESRDIVVMFNFIEIELSKCMGDIKRLFSDAKKIKFVSNNYDAEMRVSLFNPWIVYE